MKNIINDKLYNLEEIQSIVMEKLRALGFENVSKESLFQNDVHRSLFKNAIEVELNILDRLKEELSTVLVQTESTQQS